MRTNRLLLLAFPLLTTAVGCNCGSPPVTTIEPLPGVTLEAIVLAPEAVTVEVGATAQLTATGHFSDGSEGPVDGLRFESSSPERATVSAEGLVQALAEGVLTVRATKDALTSNEVTVTVKPPPTDVITVTPSQATVPVGRTVKLTATLTHPDGSSEDVTATAEWSSTAPSIATVTAGQVSGKAQGAAQVLASVGGIASMAVEVTVTAPVVAALEVTPALVTRAKGQTAQLGVTATWSDDSQTDVTSTVTWTTGSASVATVDASGLLTAVEVGNTFVRATLGEVQSADVDVAVTAPIVAQLSITPASDTIAVGQQSAFVATATYTDGADVDVTSTAAWSSSAPQVATVDGAGLATAVGVGQAQIQATFDGLSAPPATLTVTAPVPVGLQLSPQNVSLPVGLSQTLLAELVHSDGSTIDVSASATWSSADTAVATVDSNGVVAAIAPGSTTVSASKDGFTSNAVSVTVVAPVITSVAVTPAGGTLARGLTQQLVATATWSDGSVTAVTGTAAWSSSVPAAASVDGTGLLTAVQVGTATITASAGGVTSPGVVWNVTGPAVASISVTPQNASIAEGESVQLVATATLTDSTSADISAQASWSVGAPQIASVDGAGLAIGIGEGSTTVTATKDGVTSNAATITVTAPVVVGVSLTPATATLAQGQTQQLQAIATLSNGSTQDVTTSATWSSSDPSVTISPTGLATAALPGMANVTAMVDGVTSAASVFTVTAPVISQIVLAPATASIALGRTQAFTATATWTDGSTTDVSATATWSSSDLAVATVNGSGVATSVGQGTATITAAQDGVTSNGAALTVTAPEVVSVAISPSSAVIAKGQTQTFIAIATLSDGTSVDVSTSATWTSSVPAVATFSGAAATGVGEGTANVTASQDGVTSNTATLMVTAPVIASISVTPANATIAKGQTQSFTATAIWTDGASSDLTATATWASSNPSVALLSGATATGAGEGTATITAAQDGVTSSAVTLTVSPPVVTSLTISPANASIPSGLTQTFVATATLSDGTIEDVSASAAWSSSDPSVATFSGATATGVGPGTTTVTASKNGVTSNTATLTVTAPVMTGLSITPSNASVPQGHTQAFTAVATWTDGSAQDVTTLATWTSSSASVASIGADGVATALQLGSTTITAAYGGFTSDAANLSVLLPVLDRVEINPVNPQVAPSFSVQLSATGVYSDGSIGDLTSSVAWSSADPNVATVNGAGLATGVSAGAATISATAGGVTGTTTLTVTGATLTSISVSPNSLTLPVGVKARLSAIGFFSDGTFKDLSSTVTWASAAAGVASVGDAGLEKGLVTALAVGATSITATHNGITGTGAVTVNGATLATIQVSPVKQSLPVDLTSQYAATGLYSDGQVYDLSLTAVWSVSPSSIATITTALPTPGRVTALSPGKATITATVGAKSGSTELTVTSATLTTLSITPATATRAVGYTAQFVVTGSFSDGTARDLTSSVVWSSSNTAIATISNASGSQGLATARSAGQVTITAALGTVTSTATLTVTNATLQSLALTPVQASIGLAGILQYEATGVFTDGSILDLTAQSTWTSSNATVATVRNDVGFEGLATGLTAGSATISARFGTVSGSATLTVTSAVLTDLYISPAVVTVGMGLQKQFTASGVWSDGTTADLTEVVTWASSNLNVATISNAAGTRGLAMAVDPGVTTISIAYAGRADSTTLTVSAGTLNAITVTPAARTSPIGVQVQYKAVGTFRSGFTQDLTTQVSWTSSAPVVAAISGAAGSEGLVQTLTPGTTTITARLGSVTGSTTLTVSSVVLTGLQVTPSTASLPIGFWRQYVATATYSDGSTAIVTGQASWSSSDAAIASVSNTGLHAGDVTGISAGTTTITARFGGMVASASLTVTTVTLVSITVTPNNVTTPVGTPVQLTATGTFSDGSTLDITEQVGWKVAPQKNGTVSNSEGTRGVVTMYNPKSMAVVIAQRNSLSGNTKVYAP